MDSGESLGQRLDALVASHVDAPVPTTRRLPRPLAPLPTWLENVVFRLVWVVVAINLVGTAFGFVYYTPQLAATPTVMWPIVPVSPLATLYIALSLSCWRLGYDGRIAQLIHVLAFIGCLKYGLWSVYIQLFVEDPSPIPFLLWQFLIWSHAAMAIQAFLVPRYAEFPLWAIATGVGWYALNDLLDYFVPVAGGPHHTWINALVVDGVIDRSVPEFSLMAVSAVATTAVAAIFVVALWWTNSRRKAVRQSKVTPE